jgi:hypothetical protein
MSSLLQTLFQKRSEKKQKSRPAIRPGLECLEQRWVPTVIPHAGAVLAYPQVQALYYGSQWANNPIYNNQPGYLDKYLSILVGGPYVDMLTKAGYNVQKRIILGVPLFNPGWVTGDNLASTVTDSQIRTALSSNIGLNHLRPPDGNRLYVIFVQPNVAISRNGGTSVSDFRGYHDQVTINGQTVPYAVIAYPGGTVNNLALSWLSAFEQLTLVTSHEFAEGVTDPYYNPSNGNPLGWNDDDFAPIGARRAGEVGDIVKGETVYLNGYAVQRIADQNDQAMTPAGATAKDQVSFVLDNYGYLDLYNGTTHTGLLTSRITSVSEQSIDNQGRAMVDVVSQDGSAREYHTGQGWVYLGSGIKSAVAGQGVSYVLFNDGTVWEYVDPLPLSTNQSGSWIWKSNDGIGTLELDAGTDQYGVNMFVRVMTDNTVVENSDSTGLRWVGSGYTSASAGQRGVIGLLGTDGNAWCYKETLGWARWVAANVTAISAGTNAAGSYVIDVVFSDHTARAWNEFTSLSNPFCYYAASLSKSRNGYFNETSTYGAAFWFDPDGNCYWLQNNAKIVV